MGAVTIAIESPLQDELRTMIAELNRWLTPLTPPEARFHMTVEEMAEPHTSVFVARENGVAVAIGALRRHTGGVGEVKRMYTLPSHQGRGIGALMVAEIEALARREGYRRLVLETGLEETHTGAWRVYRRAGFESCGPVLDYPAHPYSAFFAKPLREGPAA
jgi:putative acetyltransferase